MTELSDSLLYLIYRYPTFAQDIIALLRETTQAFMLFGSWVAFFATFLPNGIKNQ